MKQTSFFVNFIIVWFFWFLFFLKITVHVSFFSYQVRGVCALLHEINISNPDPGIVGLCVLGLNYSFRSMWAFVDFDLWCGVLRKLRDNFPNPLVFKEDEADDQDKGDGSN